MKKALLTLFLISSVSYGQQFGFYIGGAETEGAKVKNDLFLPIIDKENFLTFIDLRHVATSDDPSTIHVGLGVRTEMENEVILGANTSFSAVKKGDGNSYYRMTYGMEILTPYLDYRLNFYHGLNEKRVSSSEIVRAQLSEQGDFQLAIDQADCYSAAMNGFDLMIGNTYEFKNDLNLGVYGGVYGYYGNGYESVTGGQVSLSLSKGFDLNNQGRGEISLSGLYRGDTQGNHRVTGGLQFRLELGNKKKRENRDRYSSLNHQDSVVTGQREEQLDTRVVDGTVNIGGIDYSDIKLLDNSFDFIDIIESAEPGTLVVLNGEAGNYILGSDVLHTNDNQAVAGGGTVVLVTDKEGRQAILVLPGEDSDMVSVGNGGIIFGEESVLINIDHHHLKGVVGAENDVIINGSFEDGHDLGDNRWCVFSEIEGWVADLAAADAPIEIQNGDNIGGIGASDGSSKLELDSHDKNGFTESNAHVYQDVETEEGETYRLTLDYSARVEGSDTSAVGVYVDGKLVMTLDNDYSGWETQEIVFNASSDLTRIEFRAMGDEDTLGGYIDNVRMEQLDF